MQLTGLATREFDPVKDNTPEWGALLDRLAGDPARLRAYYCGPFQEFGRVYLAFSEEGASPLGTVGLCVQRDLCDGTLLGVIVGLSAPADAAVALVKQCITKARELGCLTVHVATTQERAGYFEAMGLGFKRTTVSLETSADVALPQAGE